MIFTLVFLGLGSDKNVQIHNSDYTIQSFTNLVAKFYQAL